MGAPCGRMGAFSTYPAQISQIRDGKSTLSQSALIVFDPVQISQICDGKSPPSSGQDQTRSELPKFVTENHASASQPRSCLILSRFPKFVTENGRLGKSGQDQTRSGFPKFVTENGQLRVDFPSRLWEIWTGSDTIRASQICDGKWLAEGGFSVTNLGNPDRV